MSDPAARPPPSVFRGGALGAGWLIAMGAAHACSLGGSLDGLSDGPAAGGAAGAAGVGPAAGGAAGAPPGGAAGGGAGGAAGSSGGRQGAAGCAGAPGCGFDLLNDPANCGAPGHDCLGGACQLSICQPVAIVTGQVGTVGLATDGKNLFWTNQDTKTIWRSAPDGTDAAPLLGGDAGEIVTLEYIAVRGDSIYWTDWGDGTNGRVMRAVVDGSSPKLVVDNQPNPTGIAVGEGELYFTTFLDPGELRSVPLEGGKVKTLAFELSLPEGVAFAGGTIFVAQNGGDALNLFAADGSSSSSYSTGAVASPAGLAADARYVYWANQGQDTVMRLEQNALTPALLATGQGFFTGVAVDETSVYWVALRDGVIYRLAK